MNICFSTPGTAEEEFRYPDDGRSCNALLLFSDIALSVSIEKTSVFQMLDTILPEGRHGAAYMYVERPILNSYSSAQVGLFSS